MYLNFVLPLGMWEFGSKIAKSGEIKDEMNTPYGTKYVVDGKLDNPAGKVVKVRTLWIIEKGKKLPRFVTIYPV